MKKIIVLACCFFIAGLTFGQEQKIIESKNLPKLPLKVYIEGFPRSGDEQSQSISEDSLKDIFFLKPADPSYKVVQFLLSHDCDACDIWEKVVTGNKVDRKAIRLPRPTKGTGLDFNFIIVEKDKRHYVARPFYVLITD